MSRFCCATASRFSCPSPPCRLFLCFLYGAWRVRREHLDLLQMPKGRPWIVSNGDQIDDDIKPMHFVLVAVIWVVLTFVLYLLIRQALPRRGPQNMMPNQEKRPKSV